MNYKDVAEKLGSANFIFAKSMPKFPHFYTLRQDWDDKEFEDVVVFIRKNGKIRNWYGQKYIYYDLNGYEYWTMGASISETILINKAKRRTMNEYDGYTQPIVTVYDKEKDKYVIVDGFHRYYVCKTQKDIRERNMGLLPVVVIDKPIEERMAATIRHNRARGEHSVTGMTNIVFQMLKEGLTDLEICEKLGMEPEELLRLKHISGFSKLFQDIEFSRAWKHRNQIALETRYKELLPEQTQTVVQEDIHIQA